MPRAALLVGWLLAASAAPAAEPAGQWSLIWSDEFEGSRIDAEKWSLADDCWGGGNAERQCYTRNPANAFVSDGRLSITARRDPHRGPAYPIEQRSDPAKSAALAEKPFTSARLSTKGHAAWRYGRFEIRAKLPPGQGSWPAIWMLPDQPHYGRWAASGEIDIMEAVNLGTPREPGSRQPEDSILGTLHFGGEWPKNTQLGSTTTLPLSADGFHTYALEWSADRMHWSIDGKRYATITAADWSRKANPDDPVSGKPFDQPFHLILNLAIGGGLPEGRNLGGVAETGFPRQMVVDWVRVYRCTVDPETGKACEQ